MLAELLLSLALAPAPQSPQGVVINEFSYDDSGSDNYEFIELYNGGSQTVDISGWLLNGIEGSSGGAPNGQLVVGPNAVLAPGQFWLIGQGSTLPTANFPTANQPLGSVLRMENGPDGLQLTDATGIHQDGVVWEYTRWTAAAPTWLEGDGLGGDIQLHEHANNFNSVSRGFDGIDTDSNGCDFRPAPWTPGALNITGYTTNLPYLNDFDAPVGTSLDADFIYSFVPGRTADPAAVIVDLVGPPQTFPASPQGGNLGIWHDASGGGNANWLKNFPTVDYTMEAYVYLTGPNPNFAATDGEHWVMGVRGHSDSFGEPADIGGYHAMVACTSNQSGHTGVAWVCNRTATICELYLVDYNNGGGDFTILAGPIAIQTGVNDGWQRFRLSANGSDVVANFGGTLGCDDGLRLVATNVSQCANGAYLTYRECVSTNANMTPLMTDALSIVDGLSASSSTQGTGSPSSVGVPAISAVGQPTIGNAAFAIAGSNMKGPSNPFCGLVVQLGPPLPGIQVPGAPVGALQYVNPMVAILGFATASGTVNFPLAIPCGFEFTGIVLSAQIVDYDAALPNAVPIGTSQALVMSLGI